jgi:hypothetical protein
LRAQLAGEILEPVSRDLPPAVSHGRVATGAMD